MGIYKIKDLKIIAILLILSGLVFSVSAQKDSGKKDKEKKKKNEKVEEAPKDTLKYRNGAYYVGETLNRRPHGQGSYLKPDGQVIYKGGYEMGKKQGVGAYYFKNGNIYVGDWFEDKMEGKGTLTFANGEKYEGDWKSDQRHGQGKYSYGDGSVYEGSFMNGVREGTGTFTTDTKSYVGDWVNGVKNGQGYEVIMGADFMQEYRGGFVNSRYHGNGSFKHEKDTILIEYIGNWRDGDRIGEGTYTINGRVFEGVWDENQTTGKGFCKTDEGVYEGNFRRGFFHGTGLFVYHNGEMYEGEWFRGKKQGIGKFTYDDKHTYEGEWHMDQPNGKGTMTYPDGSTEAVTFRNGKQIDKD